MESLEAEWEKLAKANEDIEKKHDEYMQKIQELTKLKEQCQKDIKGQNKFLTDLKHKLSRAEKEAISEADKCKITDYLKKASEVESKLSMIQSDLPVQSNGFYLSLILGSNLNLSLPSSDQRYKYKHDYENFKWKVTITSIIWVLLAWNFPWRVVDSLGLFLLVWYYCTLTIRETILRINGSKIKGWWVAHHYISTVLSGIVLIWKDGVCYQSFRSQFLLHVAYICMVQLFQVQYQSGCLRRLHSLGQGHQMDLTTEGFTSFMFKGLTFLLPFLMFGYIFQLYNAYVLWNLTSQCQNEWNAYALCFLFFFLASGNIITTSIVIFKKFRSSDSYGNLLKLTSKYRRRSSLKKRHQE